MHYAFSDGTASKGAASPLKLAALAGPNPGALLMYRYRPQGLAARAPLLVILHGCGQTAAALDQGAGWSALARRFGFAILAPEQSAANNMGTCFNWFLPSDTARGQGEAASIHQMIEETAAEFSSDRDHIFITGLSAGGGMTSAMLAAYPEIFSAGAIIAGLAHGAASNVQEALGAMRQAPASGAGWGDAVRRASAHKGPWPRVSVWHGDADRTVNISNQGAIVAQWRDVHGLTAAPKQTRKQSAIHRRWQDGRGQTMLESYEVPGLGHGIPIKAGSGDDCCGQPAPFILEAGIASSLHIAEFFGLVPAAVKATKPSPSPVPPVAAVLPKIPLEMPRKLSAPPYVAQPIRTVIVKALKAAGLIRKR